MNRQFGKFQKIVIVEDNQALAEIYRTRMELLGYTVFAAFDGVQALTVIERELPDLVLLDLMVPKIAGDQILEKMRQSDWGKDISVIIISNLNEVDAPAGIRNLGIESYAVKANLSKDELDKLVEVVLTPTGQLESVSLEPSGRPEFVAPEQTSQISEETSVPGDNLAATQPPQGEDIQPGSQQNQAY